MNTAASAILEPEPIEIDPRPCGLCGLTIDRHEMVDEGEGPEFFCTGEIDDAPPAGLRRFLEQREKRIVGKSHNSDPDAEPRRRPEPYRPAESTAAAFLYVVGLDDPDYLAAWLAKHPVDAPHLLKIWKATQCSPTR
jgi:hypothetical protein